LLDFQPQLDLLESQENVFGPLVVAHLQSQATRRDPTQRMNWKIRLFRGLRQRNLSAAQVRELLRIVDWFLDLPSQQEQQFQRELQVLEREEAMPFIPSYERQARAEGQRQGLLTGIETSLRLRFGLTAELLMPEVQKMEDPQRLELLLKSISPEQTLDEFRALLSQT
jgi:hypothetical protein